MILMRFPCEMFAVCCIIILMRFSYEILCLLQCNFRMAFLLKVYVFLLHNFLARCPYLISRYFGRYEDSL
jgi:hypothetical protein